MPTEVDEDNADYKALTIRKRQVLIRMVGAAEQYWVHILFYRIGEARWVTADPNHEVQIDDLDGEEVIPVVPGAVFPAAGFPILAFTALTEAELAGLRA